MRELREIFIGAVLLGGMWLGIIYFFAILEMIVT